MAAASAGWIRLVREVRACTICAAHLPNEPRPVLQFNPQARVLIVGQAPGRRVHETGIPFNDVSGDRLRDWLGIDRAIFYDERLVALLPMGFCFPGTAHGGDLPPRKECAVAWRTRLLAELKGIELTIVLGRYALAYHLPQVNGSVGEVVGAWRSHWPSIVPLPHPSPRNKLWVKRHPWFVNELLPALRKRVREVLRSSSQ